MLYKKYFWFFQVCGNTICNIGIDARFSASVLETNFPPVIKKDFLVGFIKIIFFFGKQNSQKQFVIIIINIIMMKQINYFYVILYFEL